MKKTDTTEAEALLKSYAVYENMLEWLVKTQDFTEEEAVEWIDYNTIRALSYYGDKAPIILFKIKEI